MSAIARARLVPLAASRGKRAQRGRPPGVLSIGTARAGSFYKQFRIAHMAGSGVIP
ncbi:hypothetical protein [Cupriavidus sp. TMH.W2]|uniref:hypothetical protein n=1 Tax=Cupriavidus sp. TMH.W2 TaxID=3434465 RepID=UPI003D77B78D